MTNRGRAAALAVKLQKPVNIFGRAGVQDPDSPAARHFFERRRR